MKMMKKFFWLIGLLSLGLLTACGSGSGTSVSNGSSGTGSATAVTQGQAVDPYIQGAVFEEIGPDGTVLQSQSSPSDAQGLFSFPKPLTAGSTIEMKSSSQGQEYSTSYQGQLKRVVQVDDSGTLVVSPLTTLMANGVSTEQILALLKSAGIQSLTVADLTKDPMQGLAALTGAVSNQRL